MTNSYQVISKYYDRLMSDYPYESVLQFVLNNAHGRGIELGSGTGKITIALNRAGLKTVGVDSSEAMLTEAMANARKACVNAVFVNADVREYEFFPCDFVLAPCDVFNYVTDEAELKSVLKRAYDALNAGGIMLFDVSTARKLSAEVGTYMEDYDDLTVVWDNAFDGTMAELNLTVFELNEDGTYARSDENHEQRAYSVGEITGMLSEIGFEVSILNGVLEPLANGEENTADRLFFLCKK